MTLPAKNANTDDLVCVVTTVASGKEAERLARSMISQSMAACVQIDGPIISHYRWAGEVQQTNEYRLTIKTTQLAWPRLQEMIAKDHPYDEPELIQLHIDDATAGYAGWVIEQTS